MDRTDNTDNLTFSWLYPCYPCDPWLGFLGLPAQHAEDQVGCLPAMDGGGDGAAEFAAERFQPLGQLFQRFVPRRHRWHQRHQEADRRWVGRDRLDQQVAQQVVVALTRQHQG